MHDPHLIYKISIQFDSLVSMTMNISKPKERKKAIYSCDRCKSKKRRCVRKTSNEEGGITLDMAYPCTECCKSKSLCHTSLANRKQSTAVYKDKSVKKEQFNSPNNIEIADLVQKNEILTSIVHKIFSNMKVNSMNDLKAIARLVGVEDLSSISENEITPETSVEVELEQNIKEITDSEDSFKFLGNLASPAIHNNIIESMKQSGFSKTIFTRTPHFNVYENQREVHKNFSKEMSLVEGISKPDADEFVNIYFTRINPVFNYLDQSDFLKNYELSWLLLKNSELLPTNILYLKTTEICCIYLVMILSRFYIFLLPNIKFESNALSSNVISKYLDLINTIIPEAILKPSISGIQMLLLLANYFDINNAKDSACILIKLASTQAISLGINKKAFFTSDDINDKTKSYYTTLWWAVFCSEVELSNTMGRPSSIDLDDCNVEMPLHLQLSSYRFRQLNYHIYYVKYVELHQILYSFLNFKTNLIKSSSEGINHPTNLEQASKIRRQLYHWKASLPTFLKNVYENTEDSMAFLNVSLHLKYHYYFINLGTPFLLVALKHVQKGHLIPKGEPVHAFTVTAINCSKQLYNIFQYQYDNSLLDGIAYSGVEILYHGVMALTLGILILTHKNKDKSFDLAHLSTRHGIDFLSIWRLLCNIRELNKKLVTVFNSMSNSCNLIEDLLEDLTLFLNDKSYFVSDEDVSPHSNHSIASQSPEIFEDFNSILNNFNLNNKGFFEHMELQSPYTFPLFNMESRETEL